MALARSKSIKAALEFVASSPGLSVPGEPINVPTWELVGRTLFEIAHSPDPKVKSSIARATRAQKLILDRMVGVRRPGTHPARMKKNGLEFVDLTQSVAVEEGAHNGDGTTEDEDELPQGGSEGSQD